MKKLLLSVAVFFTAIGLNAQTNLLTNGDFSAGDGVLAPRNNIDDVWASYTDDGGTVEVIDGVAVATIAKVNTDQTYHLQLEQWGADIEMDKTYTLKFRARAEASRTIQFTVEDPNNSYHQLGYTPDADGTTATYYPDGLVSKWTIPITTKDSIYERTFTVFNMKDNTVVKTAFLFSAAIDKVYIDDVSIAEKTNTRVSSASVETFSVYPSPAHGVLYVKGTRSKIRIFDITGKNVIITTAHQINISSLPAGLYIVQSDEAARKIYVK